MHEMSLCQAIAATVEDRAEGRTVRRVDVRIGHLRQVVPDALQFSWEVLTAEGDLAGADLVVEHVPAVVVCDACGLDTTLELPIPQCAGCGSFDVALVSGQEFQIVSIDVANDEVA